MLGRMTGRVVLVVQDRVRMPDAGGSTEVF
jgi:hypothetical protein